MYRFFSFLVLTSTCCYLFSYDHRRIGVLCRPGWRSRTSQKEI